MKGKSIVDFPDLQALEAEAAALIARLDQGDMAAEEIAEVRGWMAKSPQHRASLERMAAIWGASDILGGLRDYPPVEAVPEPKGVNRRYAGIAAAFLFLAIGAGLYTTLSTTPKAYQGAYETARGEQREMSLPDGSNLILNTNSSIEINYSKSGREISLARGEAFFEVSKDAARPFRVSAGDGVVEATGTAFSVRLSEAKEIEVTVAEGTVALSAFSFEPEIHDEHSDARVATETEFIELVANQRAVFAQRVESLESVEDAALDRALSWRRGVLIFAGDPLNEVVDEITRYADVEIVIADPSLMERPVGGYFRIGEVDAMLRSLEAGFGVRVEREDEKKIILRKKDA